jgi:glycosyltransferase involved in cell wall biosynthesis
MEAMATGAPVVCTDAGSMTEIVEHGVSGLVVAQRDPAALAAGVIQLFGDQGLRARLGHAASRTARERCDVRACEHLLHERIRSAIGRRRAARA